MIQNPPKKVSKKSPLSKDAKLRKNRDNQKITRKETHSSNTWKERITAAR